MPKSRPTPEPEVEVRARDTEIAVAVFRTIFILIVLFSPQFMHARGTQGALLVAAVIAAASYNLALFLLHVRGLPFPRLIIIVADLSLISLWVYFCGPEGERFFVLYYAVVIVAGLWFDVVGAILSALLAAALYVVASRATPLPEGVARVSSGTVLMQIAFLIITAGVVSIAARVRERERQALTQSRAALQEHWQRIRIAQHVDEMLRPRRLPATPGLDIAFRFRPAAHAVSGDYYDVIHLGGRCWGVCVADVRAKQETGMFYVPIFRSALRVAARREQSPARVLGNVNNDVVAYLEERGEPEAFIGVSYTIIDLDASSLVQANAGIEPGVIVPADGEALVTPSASGIVLGVLPDATYEEERLALHAGDTLVLFTDGMTDVADRRSRTLGREGLVEQIKAHARAPTADAMAGRIFDYANAYGKTGQRRDDMTLFVVRITAPDVGARGPSEAQHA